MTTWVRQAPGWYTSERGVIERYGDRDWRFYPRDRTYGFGPYRTLAEAKRAAESSDG